jgi:hypothetical protein
MKTMLVGSRFFHIYGSRRPVPSTAQQLKLPGDYRMSKSFLLPSEEEGGGVAVKNVKNRLIELLKKIVTGGGYVLTRSWAL